MATWNMFAPPTTTQLGRTAPFACKLANKCGMARSANQKGFDAVPRKFSLDGKTM
jgi:hypothetical protein